jgi:hypothetical protein
MAIAITATSTFVVEEQGTVITLMLTSTDLIFPGGLVVYECWND